MPFARKADIRKRREKVRAELLREHEQAVATGVLFKKEAIERLLDFILSGKYL